ncbi:hypothetical protein V6K52_11000 [Knoellia sp. S7-12]|uniref:hypothetical protein n=1 Tax=Knoellia sp. S7-12 TaxID=3126698 RepID=UPI003368D968
MRKTYNVLGWVIAGFVMLQAALIAWGVGGENRFIENGGVMDKALAEAAEGGGEPPFPEAIAFQIHSLNGILMPVLALMLVGISFGARLPKARRNAGILFGLIFVQHGLGMAIVDSPLFGLAHGLNALLVFMAALMVARHKPASGVGGNGEAADVELTSAGL